jgi:predicted O-methyltransferase YrrM
VGLTEPARRVLRAAGRGRGRATWQPAGHFYSPLTSDADVARAIAAPSLHSSVDLRERAQLALAGQLAPMWPELPQNRRWSGDRHNGQYGLADAAVYSSMLRNLRPKRVVEVGSGFSSAVALDARDAFDLDISLTFIEPYTERLERLLTPADRSTATIRREMVQDTPVDIFDALDPGDVLFIDSTHVLKAGSDVEHLLFRVLPRLPVGTVVHIHDMFWPWQYPNGWLRAHRDWNELYAVHAFLAYNSAWEIVLFSDWLWREHATLPAAHLPSTASLRPGSLWLRRTS